MSNYLKKFNNDYVKSTFNQSEELKEIDTRLDHYISTVKDLTRNFKQQQPSASIAGGSVFSYFNGSSSNLSAQHTSSNSSNNTLLSSMKSLEKDLETFKRMYDEEFRKMRSELEEFYIMNNKLSMENFNLESKLKEFIAK